MLQKRYICTLSRNCRSVAMKEIFITRDGRPASRIVFCDSAADAAGAAGLTAGAAPVFLVYDRAVERHVLPLQTMAAASLALDGVSEERKTLEEAERICEWLMSSGADRNAVVMAAGGGIVLDLAGFAAAVYKRGVRCMYVPTTLLSQVDAAIGGKTGVNCRSFKNIIGAFRQPEAVFVCSGSLAGLPEDVFRDGLAEMLKTFIIDDGGKFGRFVEEVGRLSVCCARSGAGHAVPENHGEFPDGAFVREAVASAEFRKLIAEAAEVKAGIVSRDETESGERRKLNLGHTFAHAVEWCASPASGLNRKGISVSHGQAVAIGIALASRLAASLGISDGKTAERISGALETCGLPSECPFSLSELAPAMSRDKKAENGAVRFVLPAAIGRVEEKCLPVGEVIELLTKGGI